MKNVLHKILAEPWLLTVTLLILAATLIFVMTEVTKQPDLHDGTKVVVRIDRARVDATVVASAGARGQGLAGSPPLADNRGMLFTSGHSEIPEIFMRGMTFPIDIVWISKDTVSEVTPNVQPQPGVPDNQLTRYRPAGPVDRVLEVRAGWTVQHGVQPGDPVTISSI